MWWWIVLGIVFDQLVKLLVVGSFAIGELHFLFPGVTITLAMNRGVAFSLFASSQGIGFYVLNLLIAGFNWLLIEMLSVSENTSFTYRFGLSLVITGGLSNLMDRLCYGAVVDYILLNVLGIQWPTIFNLADMLICLGCLFLLVANTFQDRNIRLDKNIKKVHSH